MKKVLTAKPILVALGTREEPSIAPIYVRVPRHLLDSLEFEIGFNRHITNNPAINIEKALRIMTALNSVNEHAEYELSRQLSDLKNVFAPIELRIDRRQEKLSMEAWMVLTKLVEVAEDKYKQLINN